MLNNRKLTFVWLSLAAILLAAITPYFVLTHRMNDLIKTAASLKIGAPEREVRELYKKRYYGQEPYCSAHVCIYNFHRGSDVLFEHHLAQLVFVNLEVDTSEARISSFKLNVNEGDYLAGVGEKASPIDPSQPTKQLLSKGRSLTTFLSSGSTPEERQRAFSLHVRLLSLLSKAKAREDLIDSQLLSPNPCTRPRCLY